MELVGSYAVNQEDFGLMTSPLKRFWMIVMLSFFLKSSSERFFQQVQISIDKYRGWYWYIRPIGTL